jgi:hypothetical protein
MNQNQEDKPPVTSSSLEDKHPVTSSSLEEDKHPVTSSSLDQPLENQKPSTSPKENEKPKFTRRDAYKAHYKFGGRNISFTNIKNIKITKKNSEN